MNRKNVKQMEVWDKDEDEKTIRYRYVLFHDDFVNALVVKEQDDYNFLAGNSYETFMYDYCREIKKPAYRAFKKGEMPEAYKDYWFREKSQSHRFSKPIGFDSFGDEEIFIDEGWRSNDDLFVYYEVQIGSTWLPVGVKE